MLKIFAYLLIVLTIVSTTVYLTGAEISFQSGLSNQAVGDEKLIPPIDYKANYTINQVYRLNYYTGDVERVNHTVMKRWIIKTGYRLDSQTGTFLKQVWINPRTKEIIKGNHTQYDIQAWVTATKQEALIYG